MEMNRLKGKWALVTGSSRGIGQQIAIGLAEQGCNIIVHGRKLENTQTTLEYLKSYDVETLACEGDLANEGELQALVDFVFGKVGGVDILYNNAAIMAKRHKIWEIPIEEWKNVFETNFFSVVKLCAAFAPEMRNRHYGRIVNLTSGMANEPDLVPDSASKTAIEKYTKELACEYRSDNVLINLLDPGWLRTDLGGPNGEHEVETVLNGAIVPALLEEDGPTGRLYSAQDFKYLK